MNWLNKPVTWKWYLGIMIAAYAISFTYVAANRERMK